MIDLKINMNDWKLHEARKSALVSMIAEGRSFADRVRAWAILHSIEGAAKKRHGWAVTLAGKTPTATQARAAEKTDARLDGLLAHLNDMARGKLKAGHCDDGTLWIEMAGERLALGY